MKTPLSLMAAAALLAPLTTNPGTPQGKSQKAQAKPPVNLRVFQMADVLAKHKATKRSYTPFFKVPSLRTGIYSLPKGGRDGQSPHGQDELYYVLSGKAKMQCDGRKEPVKEGSLIFIAAGAQHRFVDIEADLDLLVFFSSGPLQGQVKKQKIPAKK